MSSGRERFKSATAVFGSMFKPGNLTREPRLPEDTLTADSLVPQFLGHAGVPDTADAVAYDGSQRLVALSTSDGRVKVYGQDLAEALYCSTSHCATQQLMFVPNRAAVLRLAKDGLVELFSLTPPFQRCGALPGLEGDLPQHVLFWPMEDAKDFLLLGCRSGSMRVAQLHPGPNAVGSSILSIRSVSLMPYGVSAEHWTRRGVSGPLLGL
eukprot:CAMPEP_0177585528 /NCGR_PEP_ID=MMETSP0419_2-20121207/4544_1 /TAXON_ID=582737 /ORGANISM="Tetraselmis sp., Strain GSL018" /LENGTH=209 /DNA_ID=CAMNT_0019075273 /DNA_START=155 /DNA_END=781 /DNA_ORIENTATION=-